MNGSGRDDGDSDDDESTTQGGMSDKHSIANKPKRRKNRLHIHIKEEIIIIQIKNIDERTILKQQEENWLFRYV